LDVTQPLTFAGANSSSHSEHTHPVTSDDLGTVIHEPQLATNVKDYRGGVAVVLNEIQPPVTIAEVDRRVQRMRQQPDFSDIGGRTATFVGFNPANPAKPEEGFKSIAMLVSDPGL